MIYYVFSTCFGCFLLFVIRALSYIPVLSLKLDLWLLCQHNYNYSIIIIIIIPEHYRRYVVAVLNVVVTLLEQLKDIFFQIIKIIIYVNLLA